MRVRISGEAMQVLQAIIYKTYGWNKKEDIISLSQFVKLTGLSKPAICKAIRKLLAMNTITKKDNGITQKANGRFDNPTSYSLQKDYILWQPLPKKVTVSVTQKDNQPLPKKTPTKDTITKDNIYNTQKGSEKAILSKENSPSDSALSTKTPMLKKQQGWKKQYSGGVAMQICEIHEYFTKKVGKNYKVQLNHRFYSNVLNNNFSVDECKLAIDGFADDDWAMKNLPTPKWCFGEQFEKFLNEGEVLKKTMKEGRPV